MNDFISGFINDFVLHSVFAASLLGGAVSALVAALVLIRIQRHGWKSLGRIIRYGVVMVGMTYLVITLWHDFATESRWLEERLGETTFFYVAVLLLLATWVGTAMLTLWMLKMAPFANTPSRDHG